MRHRVLKYKLNRTSSHRKALLNNMTLSLIKHEQINTTLAKAKNLRPFVEKVITLAKKGSLASRKKAFSILKNKKIIEKLFTNIVKRYETRKGGYTRILKNGFRYGDMAPLAVIELVDRDEKVKGLDSGPVQKKKHDDETKSDEKNIDSSQQNQGQNIDQKVPESELKENEKIAKKLDKKIEKPRNF